MKTEQCICLPQLEVLSGMLKNGKGNVKLKEIHLMECGIVTSSLQLVQLVHKNRGTFVYDLQE